MSEIDSIQQKLLILAREEKSNHQELLTKLAGESFLARLSASQYAQNFIFKGGRLLQYLIPSERKTVDLDFSLLKIKSDFNFLKNCLDQIIKIDLKDYFLFENSEVHELNHPHMPYPGLRAKMDYQFGKIKGVIRVDFGFGDEPLTQDYVLQVLRYKGKPLIGSDISLQVYSLEQIFSEKLHTLINLRSFNSRMRDYYDLFKIIKSDILREEKLKQTVLETFKNRNTEFPEIVDFTEDEVKNLQSFWEAYVKSRKFDDVPLQIGAIIAEINQVLTKL